MNQKGHFGPFVGKFGPNVSNIQLFCRLTVREIPVITRMIVRVITRTKIGRPGNYPDCKILPFQRATAQALYYFQFQIIPVDVIRACYVKEVGGQVYLMIIRFRRVNTRTTFFSKTDLRYYSEKNIRPRKYTDNCFYK